ncbi:imidazoleglycerol-phosphate dehydratase HisB [Alkalicaulis satelles]|uniref:Imidazoleglycerol-phosphate dehydratase n=1 Tax=Alkalicaulis satelles TaxID=2609175 RepID=A0A5M6ZIX4_9PROT|nr:imidazoleglycerol-phosphate dehydratase HisB [Alkalicaulis satelles]KAA5804763.1 imidazoleglycerol-phosphate dehydratase HisB [Alkalicaulis satelles]
MSYQIDFSNDASAQAQKAHAALKNHLAALLGVEAACIVLASCPEDARRAAPDLAGLPLSDVTAERVSAPALIRLGPPRAPVTALVLETQKDVQEAEAALAAPPLVLLEAGIDALRPAALAAAQADRDARARVLDEVLPLLGAGAQITEHGVRINPALAPGLGLVTAQDGTLFIPDAAAARALAKHLGARASGRRASVRRTTKETDIALSVDLDGEGARVDTGVKFFDHMLEQIARHGGIALDVTCEGDVEVDAHHTIEDVCLALGEALGQALGDKRGIARFGFETPMDETRAGVWIDLSGRPFARFDGVIPGERVGDFPVEMCPHAFRSLAESMKAAIHVSVDGENAHHMIESCFKAFGRALRMAARIEGEALPSTKGVL